MRKAPVAAQPQKGSPCSVWNCLQQGSGMAPPASSLSSIHRTATLCRVAQAVKRGGTTVHSICSLKWLHMLFSLHACDTVSLGGVRSDTRVLLIKDVLPMGPFCVLSDNFRQTTAGCCRHFFPFP